jgi:hypothetical protein
MNVLLKLLRALHSLCVNSAERLKAGNDREEHCINWGRCAVSVIVPKELS